MKATTKEQEIKAIKALVAMDGYFADYFKGSLDMETKKKCRDCGKEINLDRFHAYCKETQEYLCALCWCDYRDKKGKYKQEKLSE